MFVKTKCNPAWLYLVQLLLKTGINGAACICGDP